MWRELSDSQKFGYKLDLILNSVSRISIISQSYAAFICNGGAAELFHAIGVF